MMFSLTLGKSVYFFMNHKEREKKGGGGGGGGGVRENVWHSNMGQIDHVKRGQMEQGGKYEVIDV